MRGFRKTILWIALATVGLLIVAQVVVMGAGLWLDTSSGQDMLRTRLDNALAVSGYKISVPRIALASAGHLYLPDATVADDGGIFLRAHDVHVTLDWAALAGGNVRVKMTAQTVALDRLPKTKPASPKPAGAPLLAPFALNAGYIHSLAIGELKIGQLTLGPSVAGRAMTLSPDVAAHVRLHDNLADFDLAGQLYGTKAQAPGWLPEKITVRGALDTGQAVLTLAKFSATAPAYDVDASGKAGLNHGEPMDLHMEAKVGDLAALAGQKGSASLSATIGGTSDAPSLDASAAVTLADYTARGLGVVHATVQATGLRTAPVGTVVLATAYGKRAIMLSDKFSTQGAVIDSDVAGNAPDLSIGGHIAFDQGTKLATGDLTASGDLASYRDLLKTPVGGKVTVKCTLSNADGRQGAAVNVVADDLQDGAIVVHKMNLSAATDDIRARKIKAASVQADGLTVPKATIASLSATVTPQDGDRYLLKLSSKGATGRPFALDGSGIVSMASVPGMAGIDATLKSGSGSVRLQGSIDANNVALTLLVNGFPLGALPLGLPANDMELVAGGKAGISGPLAAPLATAALSFAPKTGKRFVLQANATLGKGQGSVTLDGRGAGIRRFAGQASLPVSFSLKPFAAGAAPSAPLHVRLDADLDSGTVLAGFLPPAIVLSGRLSAALIGGGTLAKPDIGGTFAMNGGQFRQQDTGLMLNDIGLRGSLGGDTVTIASLSATDGKTGRITASGKAGLGDGQPLDFKLHAADVDLLRGSDLARGLLSADLTLAGKGGAYDLKGDVHAGPMNINVPEQLNGSIPELNIVDPRKAAPPAALNKFRIDVAIHAPERIFVRGWGLDAEFGGDLKAGGTAAQPLVTGQLASRRGVFSAFGRTFSLDHANLRFDGAVPPSPYLDISASAPANDITATIALTGSVSSPSIALSSTPTLPQDEVLSQLLFGKSLSSVSPFQAIQIAQTLQQFSGKGGGGGFDPLGKLRGAAGLDDLSVGQSTTGSTTVGAGKYLTNKVYVQGNAGADQKSSNLTVQYDLTQHLKLQSITGQDQTGGGVLWQWDY